MNLSEVLARGWGGGAPGPGPSDVKLRRDTESALSWRAAAGQLT